MRSVEEVGVFPGLSSEANDAFLAYASLYLDYVDDNMGHFINRGVYEQPLDIEGVDTSVDENAKMAFVDAAWGIANTTLEWGSTTADELLEEYPPLSWDEDRVTIARLFDANEFGSVGFHEALYYLPRDVQAGSDLESVCLSDGENTVEFRATCDENLDVADGVRSPYLVVYDNGRPIYESYLESSDEHSSAFSKLEDAASYLNERYAGTEFQMTEAQKDGLDKDIPVVSIVDTSDVELLDGIGFGTDEKQEMPTSSEHSVEGEQIVF